MKASRDVLVVPLSFVSDHIETLYEVDLLFADAAREAGIARYRRTRALNDSPLSSRALAGLVEDHLAPVRRKTCAGCRVMRGRTRRRCSAVSIRLPLDRAGAPRVVVVGGGIAGLAAAHATRRRRSPTPTSSCSREAIAPGGNIRSERDRRLPLRERARRLSRQCPRHAGAWSRRSACRRGCCRAATQARRRYIFRARPAARSAGCRRRASPRRGLLSIGRQAARPGRAVCGAARRATTRASWPSPSATSAARRRTCSSDRWCRASSPATRANCRCESCFPKMHEMDAAYGSLFRAMLAKRRDARAEQRRRRAGRTADVVRRGHGRSRARRGGARAVVPDRLRRHGICTSGALDEPCGRRAWSGARAFSVHCDGRRIEADARRARRPARESADLAARILPVGGRRCSARITTAPLAVVCLGYDAAALAADRGPLDGFGFLVPRGEGPRILGALWETSIYARRAPVGKALLRVMIGGATDPDAVELDADPHLLASCATICEQTMGLRLAPEFVHVVRHWPRHSAVHHRPRGAARSHRAGAGRASRPVPRRQRLSRRLGQRLHRRRPAGRRAGRRLRDVGRQRPLRGRPVVFPGKTFANFP